MCVFAADRALWWQVLEVAEERKFTAAKLMSSERVREKKYTLIMLHELAWISSGWAAKCATAHMDHINNPALVAAFAPFSFPSTSSDR